MSTTTPTSPEALEALEEVRIDGRAAAYVAVMRPTGYSLGIALEGERGYHPTDYQTVHTYDEAAEWARLCNDDLGLTTYRAAEIVLSTMRRGRR